MPIEVTDYFLEMAATGEQALDALANRQISNHDRKKTLDQLEERFAQMAADGYIDQKEVDELMARMRQSGLDPAGLQQIFDQMRGTDSSARVDGHSKFEDLLHSTVDHARNETRDSEADTMFQIQMAMSDYTHATEAYSTIRKIQHEAYMTCIKNMVA